MGTCFKDIEDDSEEVGSVFSDDLTIEDLFWLGKTGERRMRMTEHCDLDGEEQKKHAEAIARIHDPAVVGLAFCREVSELYYSCNVFRIGSKNNGTAMNPLFTIDRRRFVYTGKSLKRSVLDVKPYDFIHKVHYNTRLPELEEFEWNPYGGPAYTSNSVHADLQQAFVPVPAKRLCVSFLIKSFSFEERLYY